MYAKISCNVFAYINQKLLLIVEAIRQPYQFQADRAITLLEADRLDRGKFVESLSAVLLKAGSQAATGVTVGLVGRWGEGKSSVLHLLHHDLIVRNHKTVVVEFSPWLVSQRHDLVRSFFEELGRAVGKEFLGEIHADRRSQQSEELLGALADYVDRIAPAVDALQSGAGVATKVAAFVLKRISNVYGDLRAKEQKLAALKLRVELLLAALQVPVVVLIDEVDRIDDSDVRELMHLVRAVADFPSISYVLAYDEKRVAEALGFQSSSRRERVERGRKYLEKIVQIPIQLPIVFDSELFQLLDESVKCALSGSDIDFDGVGQNRYREVRAIIVPRLLENARDISRLTASFAHRVGLIGGDVEWPDILGYVALTLYAPELSVRIKSMPGDFVFGSSVLIKANQSFDQFFESITINSERSPVVQDLIGFLFPAISKKRSPTDCSLDDIAFRRPLLTLLRMKALSSDISRRSVIELSEMDQADRYDAVRSLVAAGKAMALAERLANLVRQGEVSNAESVWIDLLTAIDQIHVSTWSALLEQMMARREVSDVMLSLVLTESSFASSLRTIVDALRQNGSLDAAAILIRRIGLNLQRGNKKFEEQVADIGINQEWFKEIGGDVVSLQKRLAAERGDLLDVGLGYLARELGVWESQDKDAYTRQLLRSDEAFDSFILNCFGAYYSTDSQAIDELFMPLNLFKNRFLARYRELPVSAEIELRQAYLKAAENLNIDDDLDSSAKPVDKEPDPGRTL